MPRLAKVLIGSATALTLLTLTAAAAEPAKTMRTAQGEVLVDRNGMTLYTFDKDSAGKSACNGTCAANWPPLKARDDDKPSGKWSIVQRDDGSKQWAYESKPLYLWSKDSKAGDMTGDGVAGAWRVAKP